MRDVVLDLECVQDADELRGQAGASLSGDALWDAPVEGLGDRACNSSLCVGVSAQGDRAAHRVLEGRGGQRTDEGLGYRTLACLVERAGRLDVHVGAVQVVPEPLLKSAPDVHLRGPLAGKEDGGGYRL